MSKLYCKYLMAGLVSSVLVSSCGPLGLKKSADDDVQGPRLIATDEVMFNSPEDQSCGDKSVALSTAQIWHWNGTETVAEKVSLKGIPTSDGLLKSTGVLGAIHDMQLERDCDYVEGEVTCKKAKRTIVGSVVNICRSSGVYERESIESITLTTQYMTGSANAFYSKLLSSKSSILPVALIIQLRDVMHVTNKKNGKHADVMKGDNAAFGVSEQDNKEDIGFFAVYPTSIEAFAKSPLHLWEVPFVMRHEYGHNVFHAHVAKGADAVGLKVSKMGESLDHIMRGVPSGSSHLMLAEDSQAEKDLNGLNELFADLFAFYNADGAAGQLKGVIDLDGTRDPLAKVTAGGTKKMWTSKEADIYSGNSPAAENTDSNEPDFTDSHDVAAVFAYNIVQLFDAVMAGESSADKADVLLQWLNKLSTHLSAKGKEATLDSMTAEMIKVIVANKSKTGDVAKGCTEFAANMSGLPLSIAACK